MIPISALSFIAAYPTNGVGTIPSRITSQPHCNIPAMIAFSTILFEVRVSYPITALRPFPPTYVAAAIPTSVIKFKVISLPILPLIPDVPNSLGIISVI